MSEYIVSLAEDAASAYSKGPLAASHIVNAVPFLRYLPPWFPGAEFHSLALEVKKITTQFLDVPIDFIGKGLVSTSTIRHWRVSLG
jgi:hypothetical protein